MIINLLKANNPINLFVLPIIALLIQLLAFDYNIATPTTNEYLLPGKFLLLSIQSHPLLNFIVSYCLILLGGYILSRILSNYQLCKKEGLLPVLLFFIFSNFWVSNQVINPVLINNLLLLLAINQLLALHRTVQPKSIMFNAMLIVSIASLFYFPALLFAPIAWITLASFRSFVWREWVINAIALVTPYLYWWVYLFFYHQSDLFWTTLFVNLSELMSPAINFPLTALISVGLILFVFLLSFPFSLKMIRQNVVNTKKSYLLLVWILFLFSAYILIKKSFYDISILAIPLSILITLGLGAIKKKWISDVSIIVLILALFVGYFIP